MARIAGINLPNNKHIWIALTSVYGIGDTRAKYICEKVGILATKKVKDLEEKELESIRKFRSKSKTYIKRTLFKYRISKYNTGMV